MIAEIKDAKFARSRIDKIVFNWFAAIFVALAVHVVIIFIFRTGTPVPAVKKNGLENVTFLPLAIKNKVHGLDDYLFHYSNPENISKPDTKLGYSSVIAANGIREPVPEQARPKLGRNVTVPLKTDIPRIALPTEERNHDSFSELWDYKLLAEDVAPRGKETPLIIEYPLVTMEDGTILPRFFSDIDLNLVKGVETGKTGKATKMKVSINDDLLLPRVEILSESGVQELDKLAFRTIISKIKDAIGKSGWKNRKSSFIVSIEWGKGP